MKYRCAIYNYDYTFPTVDSASVPPALPENWLHSPHVPAALVGMVTVQASTPKQAAARAYVRRVGKRRARFLQGTVQAPKALIERESSPRAIARDLVQTTNWIGSCWRLDNLMEAWFIRVEPVNPTPAVDRNTLFLPRLSSPLSRCRLLHLLRYPPLN
jgi:hypothetical protein